MQLKRSQVRITPKRAEELLRLNTYAGQRNKSPAHIQDLAQKMVDGRFHNGQIAILVNGSTFLADGQHQCEAGIVSGTTFPACFDGRPQIGYNQSAFLTGEAKNSRSPFD